VIDKEKFLSLFEVDNWAGANCIFIEKKYVNLCPKLIRIWWDLEDQKLKTRYIGFD
jgi:hypothetical protein